MSKKDQIAMAEQQLIGFKHSNNGYDLESLISSMGLKKKEWERLKMDYDMVYLSEDDRQEIEEYFSKTNK